MGMALLTCEAKLDDRKIKVSGGADFYAKVCKAKDRFSSHSRSVLSALIKVNIRKDSTWDVPEPELTLAVTSTGKIIGYTIGNDMSSRSIEGENPLYLPQAKTYDRCAAVGPCIYLDHHWTKNMIREIVETILQYSMTKLL
jgi:2-dehydro-3-deoxy-D-arabinonate dehydratase